jgi:hypothetical protein
MLNIQFIIACPCLVGGCACRCSTRLERELRLLGSFASVDGILAQCMPPTRLNGLLHRAHLFTFLGFNIYEYIYRYIYVDTYIQRERYT